MLRTRAIIYRKKNQVSSIEDRRNIILITEGHCDPTIIVIIV